MCGRNFNGKILPKCRKKGKKKRGEEFWIEGQQRGPATAWKKTFEIGKKGGKPKR